MDLQRVYIPKRTFMHLRHSLTLVGLVGVTCRVAVGVQVV